MLHSLYLGSSIAISQAQGTSLILGMQIAQTKGLEAFLIQAIANSATLAIFGTLYRKNFLNPLVLDQPIVKIFTNLIQMFCLVIQLKILNETLLNFTDTISAYLLTAGMGLGLSLWMFKRGLKASIFTDSIQGAMTFLGLLGMVGYCLQNQEVIPTPSSGSDDIQQGLQSACILLSGIMTDIQHWQRAKVNKGYAFEVASFLFACYLSLVFILSKYQFDDTLNFILLFVVLGVTTSTIDSIAVALHKDFGRKAGTFIAIGICISFGLLLELSVLSIQSYFGIIRVALALYIIYWCLTHDFNNRTAQPDI